MAECVKWTSSRGCADMLAFLVCSPCVSQTPAKPIEVPSERTVEQTDLLMSISRCSPGRLVGLLGEPRQGVWADSLVLRAFAMKTCLDLGGIQFGSLPTFSWSLPNLAELD